MVEKQSEIGRDAQLAMLLRHKWRDEIEKAVDEVKLGVIPGRKRTITDKWFRRQWFRSMMRDRKRVKKMESRTVQKKEPRLFTYVGFQQEKARFFTIGLSFLIYVSPVMCIMICEKYFIRKESFMGIRNKKQETLRRLDSKTLDARFLNEIRNGLNCSL